MDELDIKSDYLGMLMIKVRALMARQEIADPDSGVEPGDEDGPAVLREQADDLSREEILEEIEGLEPGQRAELVALMWLGRGDAEKEDWRDTVRLAVEREEMPTAEYLLDNPLVAEYWAEGLDKLGYGSIVSGVDEI